MNRLCGDRILAGVSDFCEGRDSSGGTPPQETEGGGGGVSWVDGGGDWLRVTPTRETERADDDWGIDVAQQVGPNGTPPPETGALAGVWSQGRLSIEVGLNDPLRVARWCVSVGVLRAGGECRVHRKPYDLRYYEGRGLRWYCGKCRSDKVSALVGSVFEDCRLPLGKALMLILAFARELTYDKAAEACVWSAADSPPDKHTVSRW